MTSIVRNGSCLRYAHFAATSLSLHLFRTMQSRTPQAGSGRAIIHRRVGHELCLVLSLTRLAAHRFSLGMGRSSRTFLRKVQCGRGSMNPRSPARWRASYNRIRYNYLIDAMLWCASLSHHNFVPVAKPAGEAIWALISPAAASAVPLLKR